MHIPLYLKQLNDETLENAFVNRYGENAAKPFIEYLEKWNTQRKENPERKTPPANTICYFLLQEALDHEGSTAYENYNILKNLNANGFNYDLPSLEELQTQFHECKSQLKGLDLVESLTQKFKQAHGEEKFNTDYLRANKSFFVQLEYNRSATPYLIGVFCAAALGDHEAKETMKQRAQSEAALIDDHTQANDKRFNEAQFKQALVNLEQAAQESVKLSI